MAEGAVPLPGGSLHYTVRGRGQPILVLSGGPGFSGDYMTPVATQLAASFNTILPDQRGTGRSRIEKLDSTTMTLQLAVEDLELLRRHLGIGPWTVLGHSWGGILAMAYLAAHPEAVRALVLISSGGPTAGFFEPFGDNIESRLLPADLDAVAFWRDPVQKQADPQRASYESLRAKVPAYFFDRKKAWTFVAAMRPEGYTSAVNRLLIQDLQKTAYDLRQPLARARLPALVVQGRQDPVPESVALEIHALLQGSQLKIVERSGHFPWLEQPKELFDTVFGFLSALPPAAGPPRR
ncbi:MAG TPA: alpha/beta hydrolase [Thermoanaerobaculia bacterium]|nr:alpha/beta hydrolase [Thermoanaerobaculia bacterium]